MKKTILIYLTVLSVSCNSKNSADKNNSEFWKLRAENDSLKEIIQEINNKYVFDSVSVREVENDSNTYKLNSIYKSRFYFIGYNINTETHIVKMDSLLNPLDTLKLNNGGYDYSGKLDQNEKNFKAYVHAENKYGKKMMGYTVSTIRTKDEKEN